MNLELFIAKRLYGTRKGARHISRPAVAIAQWGVAIGALVMFVSICIIVGFKNQVKEKAVGFGGHIQIMNGESGNYGPEPLAIDTTLTNSIRAIKGIRNVMPYSQKPGVIVAENEYEGILLKGVGSDYDLTFIKENLVSGEIPQLTDTVASNSIIISRDIADRLDCNTGDRINLYFVQEGIKARRMTVAAIYETHLTEFDRSIAITDIYTVGKLYGWEHGKVGGIEITADNYNNIEEQREAVNDIITARASQTGELLYAPTINELYPALLEWLDLLDQTVWLILILVLGIAAFTMVSGILILILEKTNLIGIMKAVGAQNLSIKKIFIYYSAFIIGKGLIIGNAIGLVLCLVQQYTGIVSLDPEMYYMDRVPIEFNALLLPMNILMFAVSVATMVLPAMLISRIEPTKAIKFE